jgi:hypothetical protein
LRLAGVLEHPPPEGKAKMRTAAALMVHRGFADKANDEGQINQDLATALGKSERKISGFPKQRLTI